MLRYPSIYEQPHIWFNEPRSDGLTQLVIPMDSWLGFLFIPLSTDAGQKLQ